jgi:hypothetical protein
MYCTEGLNPRVYNCRLAHQALFRQGFKLMSSWAGVRHCHQRASYPAEIVRVLAWFSTELPPVPSECCTASGLDKCVAAMAYLCLCSSSQWVVRGSLSCELEAVDCCWVCLFVPSCICYATTQTAMSDKTYKLGVTSVEDLTPRVCWRTKFYPVEDSNRCPSDQ